MPTPAASVPPAAFASLTGSVPALLAVSIALLAIALFLLVRLIRARRAKARLVQEYEESQAQIRTLEAGAREHSERRAPAAAPSGGHAPGSAPAPEPAPTEDAESRSRADWAVIDRLSVHESVGEGDVAEVARLVTEAGARLLQVDRVTLWLAMPDGTSLVCQDAFHAPANEHRRGARLDLREVSAYTAALEQQVTLAVRQTRDDPRVRGLPDRLASTDGSCARLDAVIRLGKGWAGVLSHEHTGGPRTWLARETALATSLAALLTRTLLNARLRQNEQDIRTVQAQLESRVGERTDELRRRVGEVEQLNRGMINLLEDLQEARVQAERDARRLAQANAQLDAANRELESFSYSVSHDLRAPLRNIAGFAEILSRTLAPTQDQARHHLSIIATEAARMGALIDDLLDFSRIGRAQIRREWVDNDVLVAEVRDSLAPDFKDRHVVWDLQPLPRAFADRTLLRQVWFNLISNAVKYTRPRATAHIRIAPVSSAAPASETAFLVRDNGVGFDMAYADKLFGVFQRLHSAREFEGTGIGLANVQRILVRHGGRVWAESQLDSGSTFYFALPAATPEPAA